MRGLFRGASAAALLAGLLGLVGLLGACGRTAAPSEAQADYARQADAQVPDCADEGCTAQVAALARSIGRLPGVVSVTGLQYHPAKPLGTASVSGQVRVDPAFARDDCDRLVTPVGRALWASQVSPVDEVALDCFSTEATAANDYAHLDVVPSQFSVTDLQSWGPRGG